MLYEVITVRLAQIERLKKLRNERNEAEVQASLAAITKAVETGKGNLLELAIDAAKKRASLGEISDACEKIVGRYKAVIRTIEGVYKAEAQDKSEFQEAQELAKKFAEMEGRQPRIMIAKMGRITSYNVCYTKLLREYSGVSISRIRMVP